MVDYIYNISGSEALTMSRCETDWMLRFHPGYSVEPLHENDNLVRGTLGHDVLDKFFSHLKETNDYDASVQVGQLRMATMMAEAAATGNAQHMRLIPELIRILTEYWIDAREEILSWEIIGVELKLEMTVTDEHGMTVKFVGRIDLLIKKKYGDHKGELIPVDHKFKYNFFTPAGLDMNQQMPGYVELVRQNFPGSVVKRAYMNQIRYRVVKEADKRRLERRTITTPEIKGVMKNYMLLISKAVYYRRMKLESVQRQATRTISEWTCERCSVRTLCKTLLLGQDPKPVIAVEYKPRTYGYDHLEDDE